MFKVEITLPLVQHNGTSNVDTIEQIEQAIAIDYKGYSATSVRGGWFDSVSKVFYHDESILVWTFVDSEADVARIKKQAIYWAESLQQIELLVTVAPAEVCFVEGTRAQAA